MSEFTSFSRAKTGDFECHFKSDIEATQRTVTTAAGPSFVDKYLTPGRAILYFMPSVANLKDRRLKNFVLHTEHREYGNLGAPTRTAKDVVYPQHPGDLAMAPAD